MVCCILTFPFSVFLSVKFVKNYERIVILRLGRVINKEKVSGTFYVIPFIDKYRIVDLRLLTFNIPPQQVLTSDSVTVNVDAILFYRITNATVSVIYVEDAHKSTQLLAQTTLRDMIGTYSMYELLTDRLKIAASMQTVLHSIGYDWGIKVERVEIKDVSLPVQLQKALAREAEETRNANAKIISANGEKQASRELSNAAKTLGKFKFIQFNLI